MGEQNIEKLDFDPYELLELTEECSPEDVKKAYRKKALTWHPDKNPDKREYAETMFLKVARASEILLDTSAKAALDRLKQAKRVRQHRTQNLDAKRRKLREDLESREKTFQSEKETEQAAAERLEKEIERLRKQGSDLLKNIREEIERQVHSEARNSPKPPPVFPSSSAHADDVNDEKEEHFRLKVRWSGKQGEIFDHDFLRERFSTYGQVTAIVLRPTKKKTKDGGGTALIEFATFREADTALRKENALQNNVLRVEWLQPPPSNADFGTRTTDSPKPSSERPKKAATPPQQFQFSSGTLTNDRDFESLVLTRMRQAEERKRLMEEIQRQDDDIS